MRALAYILGTIIGLIGAAIAAGILIWITIKTGMVFGIATIILGAIAGGAFAIGYRIGGGEPSGVSVLVAALMGLIAIGAAYFGPGIWLSSNGLDINTYLELIEFGILDVVFIVIGALGGRAAGRAIINAPQST